MTDQPRFIVGHGLQSEGWPHDAAGRRIPVYRNHRIGRAKCLCGELSEELPSTSARKRWHREHKAAVLAEQETVRDHVPDSVRDVIAQALADRATGYYDGARKFDAPWFHSHADTVIRALTAAGHFNPEPEPEPLIRVLSGQVGRSLNHGDAPGRYEQWVLRIDCDLNGCDPHHSDEGDTVSVDDDRWVDKDGIGRVNGHKARLERRSVMVGPWEVVPRG